MAEWSQHARTKRHEQALVDAIRGRGLERHPSHSARWLDQPAQPALAAIGGTPQRHLGGVGGSGEHRPISRIARRNGERDNIRSVERRAQRCSIVQRQQPSALHRGEHNARSGGYQSRRTLGGGNRAPRSRMRAANADAIGGGGVKPFISSRCQAVHRHAIQAISVIRPRYAAVRRSAHAVLQSGHKQSAIAGEAGRDHQLRVQSGAQAVDGLLPGGATVGGANDSPLMEPRQQLVFGVDEAHHQLASLARGHPGLAAIAGQSDAGFRRRCDRRYPWVPGCECHRRDAAAGERRRSGPRRAAIHGPQQPIRLGTSQHQAVIGEVRRDREILDGGLLCASVHKPPRAPAVARPIQARGRAGEAGVIRLETG